MRNKLVENIIFLGIDQTGAVNKRGIPKPLPACLIRNQKVEFFYLDKLSKEQIEFKTKKSKNEKIIICIDCVLGLPVETGKSWRNALKIIKKQNHYGMEAAQKFFFDLGKGKIHRRKIEILCNANSVFKTKPFQKNIQTGTFRIWKDISDNEDSFYVPALEQRSFKNQIPLFEGYPTLSWQLVFKSRIRRPELLPEFIKKNKIPVNWDHKLQSSVQKDINLADALALALTLKLYNSKTISNKKDPEGTILGTDFLYQV
jgi:hypothetical protein